MKKRMLAAVLACLMLTGCGPERTEPVTEETSSTEASMAERVIVYVPLDDRPDNEERVIYLAESVGYALQMPERDLYHTALDGQPVNENGTQCGDRAALYEWVVEMEQAGCDRYILSLDQLLSGGLVSSRAMAGENPVTLSSGETLTEIEMLDRLLETLAADGNNQVWLLDTVIRLAPTVGYIGFGINEYNALRSYGSEARPELTGNELTVENIVANYPLRPDGSVLPVESEEPLADGALEDYLAARERKLRLGEELFRVLAEAGHDNFRVLYGIDDSSAEDSIQKNEIAFLRAQLREGDALLSGVDDLAFKAVTRLYQEETAAEAPSVFVSYYGGTEDQPACVYDSQPLEEIVEEHIDFFGLQRAERVENADIHMLVLTQPADAKKTKTYYNELIQQLNANEEAQRPTILIDAENNQYSSAFHQALTKKCNLGWLLAYGGLLDMAIVTGTTMSHGVARYVALQSGGERTEQAERAYVRTVVDAIVKDFCYKHIVRNDLLVYVNQELGGSADNFWKPVVDQELIQERMESGMAESAADVLKNLEQSNFIASLEPYTLRGWGGIQLDNYRFPWDRAFEIGMDIHLGAFTEPHKSMLGIYYQ